MNLINDFTCILNPFIVSILQCFGKLFPPERKVMKTWNGGFEYAHIHTFECCGELSKLNCRFIGLLSSRASINSMGSLHKGG